MQSPRKPKKSIKRLEISDSALYNPRLQTRNAPVAQLDRVLGYEPRGRAFESLRARQNMIQEQRVRSEMI